MQRTSHQLMLTSAGGFVPLAQNTRRSHSPQQPCCCLADHLGASPVFAAQTQKSAGLPLPPSFAFRSSEQPSSSLVGSDQREPPSAWIQTPASSLGVGPRVTDVRGWVLRHPATHANAALPPALIGSHFRSHHHPDNLVATWNVLTPHAANQHVFVLFVFLGPAAFSAARALSIPSAEVDGI